jgi:DNA invertase Pin-like site-specific DNA recombinase
MQRPAPALTHQQLGGYARAAALRIRNARRDRRIRLLRARLVPVSEIAKKYKLSRQAVYNILQATEAA